MRIQLFMPQDEFFSHLLLFKEKKFISLLRQFEIKTLDNGPES